MWKTGHSFPKLAGPEVMEEGHWLTKKLAWPILFVRTEVGGVNRIECGRKGSELRLDSSALWSRDTRLRSPRQLRPRMDVG